MTFKRQIDRLPIIPADAKKHNVTCHYCIVGCGYNAYTLAGEQAGRLRRRDQTSSASICRSSRRPRPRPGTRRRCTTSSSRTGKDVQLVIKPDVGCDVNSGLGLDPRRAHGRESHVAAARHAAAAAHRSDGLALWPDAADQLGRRARSRRASDRRRDQRAGRGRPVRVDVRPRRLGRRLREYLGHRQALFRRHEGQERSHPQSPGLQFRGPRHARHGRRRVQQLLRRCRTRRHASWRSAPIRSRPRPTTSSITGCRISAAPRSTRRRRNLPARRSSRAASSSSIRGGP